MKQEGTMQHVRIGPRAQLPQALRGTIGSQIDRSMAKVLGVSTTLHIALFLVVMAQEQPVPTPTGPDFPPPFPGPTPYPFKLKKLEVKRAGPFVGEKTPLAGASTHSVPPATTPKSEQRADRRGPKGARVDVDPVAASKNVGILAILTRKGGGSPGGALGDALAGGGAQADIDHAAKTLGGVATVGVGGGLAGVGGSGGYGGRVSTVSDIGRVGLGSVGGGGHGTGAVKEHRVKVGAARLADHDVEGSLDAAAARVTIGRGHAAIRACYDRSFKHNPALAGKLRVRITVAGAGNVRAVAVAATTLPDAAVVACVTATIRGWRFPASASGSGGVVEPTWVFQPAQ
jgi:hypothetical protein